MRKRKTAELDDAALLDLVQRQTLRYFWDFAHPACGLARERSNVTAKYGLEAVTTGGSGFGVMAIIAGVSRGWIARADAVERIATMVRFLLKADSYHGIWPHFLNGDTGRTIPFSRKDDGSDLVETSFLIAGLLCARQYFDATDETEARLRAAIDWLWQEAEWSWHTQGGRNVLYWHWSPNNGWSMNHEIRGWNECLITYVLAASAPRYGISPEVYHRGWADGRDFTNGRSYDGIALPLGPDAGGPLFLSQYSFLGLDPRGLADRYADYWQQNVAHTQVNRAHCVRNPKGFKGYGPDCWGLSASDSVEGYDAHSPTNDLGVITPTAALSAFPYTPEASMRALRHFYHDLGDRIWGDMGFADAFSESADWVAGSHLAIDQGPIVVMIENARSGLIWRLFMSCPEIRYGLRRLGFGSPGLTV
ncbi:MAG TPA: glucoamylase family protein [Amaricoccus sp.]|nr:glucoamylase family protein [Amaricoccus sp.]